MSGNLKALVQVNTVQLSWVKYDKNQLNLFLFYFILYELQTINMCVRVQM